MTEGVNLETHGFGPVLMALSRFIDLEFIDPNPHQWNRTERKQLARNGYKHEPSLRVVKIRRPQRKESEGSRSVDWSCQWTVEGHWRKFKNGHPPIYIHSYVKGPEDKPLKAKAETIFNVVR